MTTNPTAIAAENITRSGTPYPYYDGEGGTPVILQYWQAIMRYRFMIGAIIAIALLAGILITLLTTPYYASTARIEINRSQDKVTNVEGLQSEDASQNLEFYQTQYSLLEARSLAERVARARNLASDENFFETFGLDPDDAGFTTQAADNQAKAVRDKRLKLAVKTLLDHVSIAPVRGSSLVDISFRSPSPNLSAEIANAWIGQFIESNLDRRFDSTADARSFLEDRLAELKVRLEESERRLVLYADNKKIVTLSSRQDADGKTVTQQTLASFDLEALNKALASATSDRIIAESEFAQRGSDNNEQSSLAVANMRTERASVAAEYAKMLDQFEPGYPTVKALASKVVALDASIAQEVNRLRSGKQLKYQAAVQRERQLLNRVNLLKSQYSQERKNSIQYNIFQREVDTNRQLYDSLLQRYKEIGVTGVGSNNISVVDRAKPSEYPSSPNLILNMFLSLLAGAGLSGLYVVVREQIDQSIKDPSELKSKLGISSLGSVPDLERENILEMLQDKKSIVWEAYLSIRTNLSFLTDHGVPRSFLLTSTRPNEGKSTSALALASVLSSTGRKVLLVDGDMRNPSLHKMLGVPNDRGLSNYLAGDDDTARMIHKSETYGFYAMVAGPIPPNAAELLSSHRVKDLMTKLGDTYSCIIVDAPPVLGLADIPLLADSVEGVIYTIEANGVKAKGIASALDRVRASRARIFGGIVTKVPEEKGGYGYSYQYAYGAKEAPEGAA